MLRATKTRVVIVDDHPIFRQGMRQAIEGDRRLEVVGEAGNGEEAIQMIVEESPDVAVLDLNLSGVNGFDAINALSYVLKKGPEREILECIRAAASGEAYVSPALTDLLLRRRNNTEKVRRQQPGLGQLTTGERRILARIAQGKTSRQIANDCGISLRTVDSHRANISEKLGLQGRNRLLQFALEHRDALSHLD
jgi:DNA-binding NarL/FixJ family response regulator